MFLKAVTALKLGKPRGAIARERATHQGRHERGGRPARVPHDRERATVTSETLALAFESLNSYFRGVLRLKSYSPTSFFIP